MVCLALVVATSAQSATFRVGTGPGCNRTSLQAAINEAGTNGVEDTIIVKQDAVPVGQALTIGVQQGLRIVGGYANCTDSDIGLNRTVISGEGGREASVISIRTNGLVRLENLHITGGDSLTDGGGISYVGNGRLELAATVVDGNWAVGNGGGLSVASNSGEVQLVLEQDTGFFRNRTTTGDGGAIHLSGDVTLTAEAHRLFFHSNTAERGSGGAIAVISPARISIGAGAWQTPFTSSTFFDNAAGLYGGAIFVRSDGRSIVPHQLYSILPTLPLSLESNRAQSGGAIAGLEAGSQNVLQICAKNINLTKNHAEESGAALHLQGVTYSNACGTVPAGAVASCQPVSLCSRIDNHVTTNTLIALRGEGVTSASGKLTLKQASLQGNWIQGTSTQKASMLSLQRFAGFDGNVLEQVVVVGNRLSGSSSLVQLDPGARLAMRHCSVGAFANTLNRGIAMLDVPEGSAIPLRIEDSIIHAPGAALASSSPASATPVLLRNLFHEEPPSHWDGRTVLVGNPRFISSLDLRLADASPALDFSERSGTTPIADRDGNPRSVNLAGVPDVSGPVDLGAYERQAEPGPSQPTTFRVGSGPGCTHATLQGAIDEAGRNRGADVIHVMRGAAESGQALTIDSQQGLHIIGGWSSCDGAEPSAEPTVVSGLGEPLASVFRIRSSGTIRLENLHIVDGDADGVGDGGGIDYRAPAITPPSDVRRLELVRTTLQRNTALRGGGLHFHGGNDGAALILEQDTAFLQNEASSDGGGIHLSGRVELRSQAERVFFHGNRSLFGSGGAIAATGNPFISLGTGSWQGQAAFLDNRAENSGGAIFVRAERALVALYSLVPDRPLLFEGNGAVQGEGGAIAAEGLSPDERVWVCTKQVNFRANHGQRGAAVALRDADFSTNDINGCNNTIAPAPAVCKQTTACGRFDHHAEGRSVIEVAGGDLEIEDASFAANAVSGAPGEQAALVALRAGLLYPALASVTQVDLAATTLSAGSAMFHLDSTAQLRLDKVSIGRVSATPGNAIFRAGGVASGRETQVVRSIVHAPGVPLFELPATERVNLQYALFHEAPPAQWDNDTLLVGDPAYVSASDLRLMPRSPALDRAPDSGLAKGDAPGRDRDGAMRVVDLASVPNVFGAQDLGAFERQTDDDTNPPPGAVIFRNGFE